MDLPVIKVVKGPSWSVFVADLEASIADDTIAAILMDIPETGCVDAPFLQTIYNTNKLIVPYSRFIGSIATYGPYYPSAGAAWQELDAKGWLEVAKAIPQFKKTMFENGFQLKYE